MTPLLSVAIEPKNETERQRLAESLFALAAADPSVLVDCDRESRCPIISAASEAHIDDVVRRLSSDFNLETRLGRLQVAYRETIKGTVEQEGKFISNRSARTRFGHVVLRLAPAAAGRGVQFENDVKGDRFPREYVAAAEAGVREACSGGVLAGYPLTDVTVTLLDGSYDDADSSEPAFKIAGAMALKEGASKASPVLLEPVMAVEVVTPEELMGEIAGDLSRRRGHIQGVEARSGALVVTAHVRLQEMLGYAAALRSRTEGRASFTMTFSAYAEVDVPPDPDGNEPVTLAMRVA